MINILLIEDCLADIRLTQEMLKESVIQNKIYVVKDGEEAISFLMKKGNYNKCPSPDLIFLDLNLPKKNGREVLIEIKSDPFLKSIPVLVLTTSTSDVDIITSYKLQANCYLNKPNDLDDFNKLLINIENFWFKKARLPKNSEKLA